MHILGNSRLYSCRFEKAQKSEFFLGTLPKICFLSADTYSDHGVLPITEGVEFLPFFGLGHRKNNDILGIYFVRNNGVFSDAPEPVQNKIPKKKNWGIFPDVFFIMFSFSWLYFYIVLSGWSTTSGWASEKTSLKMAFFRWHFLRETIRCFLAPALALRRRIPYLSANRLEPRISRDQRIQTCQFKTTNVKIHPAVRQVYTHLICFGQMEMANAIGNFGNALVGLRAWNDAIHDFRRSVVFSDTNFFSGIWKTAVFSGHGSRMTVRKNPGYLWLAIWLLAGWLADWQIGIGYLAGFLNGSFYPFLSGYLDGWLAIWLAGYLAGWLGGGLRAGWLIGWFAR